MKRLLVALGALAFAPSPALAHWEWTTWGMTPDAVIAASDGKVTAAVPTAGTSVQGFDHKATGSFSKNGFDYEANFYFDAGGLRVVALSLLPSTRCRELRDALAAELGPPQTSVKVADTWTELEDDVSVNDAALIEVCKLTYAKKG